MNETKETTEQPPANIATPDEFEMPPPPPDRDTILYAAYRLYEIGDAGDFAEWDDQDLALLKHAYAVASDPAEQCSLNYHREIFVARKRIKTTIRRLRDEPRWRELGKALCIEFEPAAPLRTQADINNALLTVQRGLIPLRKPRPMERTEAIRRWWRLYRPSWTVAELRQIRSLVYIGERRPSFLSRRQAKRYEELLTHTLATYLSWESIEWLLVADAIDADVNDGFMVRCFEGMSSQEPPFLKSLRKGARWMRRLFS